MKSNRLGLALTCALVLALSPLAVSAKKPPAAAKPTGMSSKNRAQCKKYRTAQVDHYKQLADEYHKVCEEMSKQATLAPMIRPVKDEVFCGFMGVKKPPADAKLKEHYFSAAREYSNACNSLRRNHAIAKVTMEGVSCGYSGIVGGWETCSDVK